jgi:hypothetical protein
LHRQVGFHGVGHDFGDDHVIIFDGAHRRSAQRTVLAGRVSSTLVAVPVSSCGRDPIAVGTFARVLNNDSVIYKAPRSCGNSLAVLDIGSADCDDNDPVIFASGIRRHVVAFGSGGHGSRGGHWEGWERSHRQGGGHGSGGHGRGDDGGRGGHDGGGRGGHDGGGRGGHDGGGRGGHDGGGAVVTTPAAVTADSSTFASGN